MGCFSWMDCLNPKRKKNIAQGDKAYFLVPEEFCEKYGRSVFEDCYDCYGNFGGYDAYDLLAEFNKDYVTEKNLRKPVLEQYRNEEYFKDAMRRYDKSVQRLKDFQAGLSEYEMRLKWGYYYKRDIGIDIGCYDSQQEALKYPFKITHSDFYTYEQVAGFSKGDPKQGCF